VAKRRSSLCPLRGLDYKDPTPATENLYFESVNATVDYYRKLLRDVRQRTLALHDMDLDTGSPTEPGEYSLADETFTRLVDRLGEKNFASVDRPLRYALLTFFDQQQAKQNTEQTLAMQLQLIPLRIGHPALSSLYDEREKKTGN
jgi:hypothetical protein